MLRISAYAGASKQAAPKQKDDSKRSYAHPMRADEDMWVRLMGEVDADGCITIQFRVDGSINPAEPSDAPVALRLHAIGYGASDDQTARLNLLEQVVLKAIAGGVRAKTLTR